MALKVNCFSDVDKYGETKVIKNLILKPNWKWHSKTGMFVYGNEVIFAFNEFGETKLEGHCLLLRLLWTLPNARKKNKTLEALKSLVEVMEQSRCAVVAMISPFKLRRKVDDIEIALHRLSKNQFDVLNEETATTEIEGMKRLLKKAKFEEIDLHGVVAFGDHQFPSDRQHIYLPSTIHPDIGVMIKFRMPSRIAEILELYEDDDA